MSRARCYALRVEELETKLPAELRAERVLVLHVELAARQELGPSKYGARYVVPITGGRFASDKLLELRGAVLPGGADWQLVRPDGVLELDARYSLRADDGSLIHVRNRGIAARAPAVEGQPPAPVYVRTSPQFEAPLASPHAWLNHTLFLGGLELRSGSSVCIAVYRVL